MQKLVAHYQRLVNDVHERKVRCLNNLKMSKTPGNHLEPINQTLKEFGSKLKRDNIDFILKTLDGDDNKWKDIRMECCILFSKVKLLEEELNRSIVGVCVTGFRPSSSKTRIQEIRDRLDTRVLDSMIISSFTMENDLVELCNLSIYDFKLLYRASRDGFEAASFHAKCDYNSRTLTVIRTTNGYIFGAFTDISWNSKSGFRADPKAFIFSLVNASSTPALIPVKSGDKNSILCEAEFGPTFGNGHDIVICSFSNTTTESYSNLGSSYDFKLFKCGGVKAQSFLAGSRNFQTTEIEVFSLYVLKVMIKIINKIKLINHPLFVFCCLTSRSS